MGISFLSAHTFQVELQAGLMTVLDVLDLPKHVDWCFVQRRDTVLSGVNAAFREFVIANGADWARCRFARGPRALPSEAGGHVP
jgi:hypothetical protein